MLWVLIRSTSARRPKHMVSLSYENIMSIFRMKTKCFICSYTCTSFSLFVKASYFLYFRLRREGDKIFKSKYMLLIVVILCITDCALVLGELTLDLHKVKGWFTMWLFPDICQMMFCHNQAINRLSKPGTLPIPYFPKSLFRLIGMVGEAWLPSNAYFPWTPDYIPFILGLCLSV